MELVQEYLASRIFNFRLWITDTDNDIHEVKCESLNLTEHPIYLGFHHGDIIMEKWVWDDINETAQDWNKRIRILITEDAYENVTSYKLLGSSFQVKDGIVTYSFTCKKEEGAQWN